MPIFLIVVIAAVALLTIGSGLVVGGTVVSDKVNSIADAIAHAEGYGVAGAIPTKANNPGDLKLGDLGNGTYSGKTIFASYEDGRAALVKQIQLMIDGGSSYYRPSDSWRKIALTWVGTSDYTNWLNTVTNDLGVDPDSSLDDYVNS